MDTQFSLCQLEVNNCNATTVVRPHFTLCSVQCPGFSVHVSCHLVIKYSLGEVVYNHWTGLVDWTGGLDWWTGLVDWTGGLDQWTGLKIIFMLSNETSPVRLYLET